MEKKWNHSICSKKVKACIWNNACFIWKLHYTYSCNCILLAVQLYSWYACPLSALLLMALLSFIAFCENYMIKPAYPQGLADNCGKSKVWQLKRTSYRSWKFIFKRLGWEALKCSIQNRRQNYSLFFSSWYYYALRNRLNSFWVFFKSLGLFYLKINFFPNQT